MSKSSELDLIIKRYIINNINADDYDIDLKPKTVEDKIIFLEYTFLKEYGHNIARYGEQNAIEQWYRGLPSACSIDFENHRILELAEEWGSLGSDASESKRDRILDNWFLLLAAKTLQLFNGYRVPKEV